MVDSPVECRGNDGVEVHDGCVADGAVDQPPVIRGKRARKTNSKYDPAIYDLDSVAVGGSLWRERRMDGRGSIGHSEVPSPEGGGGATGI